jgi:hypothetical protein
MNFGLADALKRLSSDSEIEGKIVDQQIAAQQKLKKKLQRETAKTLRDMDKVYVPKPCKEGKQRYTIKNGKQRCLARDPALPKPKKLYVYKPRPRTERSEEEKRSLKEASSLKRRTKYLELQSEKGCQFPMQHWSKKFGKCVDHKMPKTTKEAIKAAAAQKRLDKETAKQKRFYDKQEILRNKRQDDAEKAHLKEEAKKAKEAGRAANPTLKKKRERKTVQHSAWFSDPHLKEKRALNRTLAKARVQQAIFDKM